MSQHRKESSMQDKSMNGMFICTHHNFSLSVVYVVHSTIPQHPWRSFTNASRWKRPSRHNWITSGCVPSTIGLYPSMARQPQVTNQHNILLLTTTTHTFKKETWLDLVKLEADRKDFKAMQTIYWQAKNRLTDPSIFIEKYNLIK